MRRCTLGAREAGLTTDFARLPCREGTLFDPDGNAHAIRCQSPVFYMIERGPGPDTLDGALLRQAVELGAEVRFTSRLDKINGPGVIASGPKAADATAVGYHFSTDMADGYWAICDDNLAPQGYAFESLVGLQMKDPKPHGGFGNFSLPRTATSSRNF